MENNEMPNKTNEEKRTVLTETKAKKTFLDTNASWPLMIIYLGYLIGMFYTQRITTEYLPAGYNTYLFTFMPLIFGILITFLVYNLGKIISANIAGYKLIYIKFLGFLFNMSGKETKVTFRIENILDVAMQFTPKDDDVKKNPRLIFVGGFIAEIVLLAISLTLFFLFGFKNTGTVKAVIGWASLFAFAYGFVISIYEILPLRQDYPTDMFNLLVTKTKEDQLAFNVVHINKNRELNNTDFLTQEFEDYDSFYRSQVLYDNYLNAFYDDDNQNAKKFLALMQTYAIHLPEEERYLYVAEAIYTLFINNQAAVADKKYLNLTSDDKKAAVRPTRLSGYRTALLIYGNISSDKDRINELLKDYHENYDTLKTSSKRIIKEKELFAEAYAKLKKDKPGLNLK